MRSMWVTCARLLASEDGRFTCTRVATATTLSAVSEERLTCRADTVTLERLDLTRRVGRIGTGRLTEMSRALGSRLATAAATSDWNRKWAPASGRMTTARTSTTQRINDRIIR